MSLSNMLFFSAGTSLALCYALYTSHRKFDPVFLILGILELTGAFYL